MGVQHRVVHTLPLVSAKSWSSIHAGMMVLVRLWSPPELAAAHSSSRILREENCMNPLRRFGPAQEGMRVEDIRVDSRSRDDIPKLPGCLRKLYLDVDLREEIFRLLEDRLGGCGAGGSPELSLWTLLVLGMLKRRLGCDFDRLHEHANTHLVLRQFLGHGEYDPMQVSRDGILRDVSLLDEDTLRAIRNLAGQSGIRLFRG